MSKKKWYFKKHTATFNVYRQWEGWGLGLQVGPQKIVIGCYKWTFTFTLIKRDTCDTCAWSGAKDGFDVLMCVNSNSHRFGEPVEPAGTCREWGPV